jgi:hypothetical protein
MTEFPTQTQTNGYTQQTYLSESYISELNERLNEIDKATTHYQTLALGQSASYEDVVKAYKAVISLLYPADELRSSLSGSSLREIEKAFRKASSAFSTLVESEKRTAYDNLLMSMYAATPALDAGPPMPNAEAQESPGALVQTNDSGLSTGQGVTAPRESGRNQTAMASGPLPALDMAFSVTSSNRRRNQRVHSSLPVKVAGTGRNFEKWVEQTESIDVSKTGVSFTLRRRVRSGTVLKVSLPLPEKFRPHGNAKVNFNSYVLVRRVDPPAKGIRIVAVEFIGHQPPPGYEERPWAVFKPKSWSGHERRRVKREDRREKVRLEYYNTAFNLIMKEDTLTENVSESGMRVVARFVPDEFEFIKVICLERPFESLAVVRSRFLTRDGMERLSLHFVNREKSRL